MGRYIGKSLVGTGGGGSGNLGSTTFRLKAGVALNPDDLVELGPDGLAYPVVCSDYAATANIGMPCVPTTEVHIGGNGGSDRLAMAVSPVTGDIYCTAPNSGNSGLSIYCYSASGVLRGVMPIWTEANYVINNPRIAITSNENIVVLFECRGLLYYAVHDKFFNQVKSPTQVEGVLYAQAQQLLRLSGGGFMICWQSMVNRTASKLAVYDNAGKQVTAPTVCATWSGTQNQVFCRMAQLDNGNVLMAFSSGFSDTSGLYYSIVTPLGATVLSLTATSMTGANSYLPEVAVGAGYFAIACVETATSKPECRVFNNAGVLQGTVFQSALGSGDMARIRLVWDGTAFWMAFIPSSAQTLDLSRIPVSGGVNAVTHHVGRNPNGAGCLDAFFEHGRMVIVYSGGEPSSGPVSFSVFNTLSQRQETVAQGFGINAYAEALRAIPVGDFSFACGFYLNSNNTINFTVAKYANTAIAGVASSASAATETCSISLAVGGYTVNPFKGSLSKVFDHSASNIIGNKGAITSNAVVLKGL